MRTSNPFLSSGFSNAYAQAGAQRMTVQGTVNKAGISLVLLLVAASWSWGRTLAMGTMPGLAVAALIAGFVIALITAFRPAAAPVTTPIYAVCEGVLLGSVSALFEQGYQGIVAQAVFITAGVFGGMLLAYTAGLLKATARFRSILFTATAGVAVIYLINFVMGFFGAQIPMIHEPTGLGIGFSLVVVAIAALNLVLDFDFIERGAAAGAPKHYEWYGAFGLLVTLVWLYLEVLRLLAKARSRR